MSKQLCYRLGIVFLGTILMGIGIQLIVMANYGADSVSTLITGLMRHTSLPFSRWSQLISLSFLVITCCYKRSMLGIGSLINSFFVGETIRWVAPLMTQLSFLQHNIWVSFCGFCVMAAGTALYLSADLGSGPMEGVMMSICDLCHISLKTGRIVLDFSIVFVGVLLGGSIGLGTLFAVFLLGPLIEYCLKKLERGDSAAKLAGE